MTTEHLLFLFFQFHFLISREFLLFTFNHSNHYIHTSQKTHCVPIMETDQQMMLRDTMALYPDNHAEHMNTVCGQNEEVYIQITWYVYVFITVFKGEIESYKFLLEYFISFKIHFYVSL
jgi:hypothetical protein